VGASGGLKSGPTVQPDITTVRTNATTETSELCMFGLPRRVGGQRLVRTGQEIWPDPAKQRMQLFGFGIGQPKPDLTLDRSEDIVDARDEWPCLGGGRGYIRAMVMRIR
jgi:hypothetical protein